MASSPLFKPFVELVGSSWEWSHKDVERHSLHIPLFFHSPTRLLRTPQPQTRDLHLHMGPWKLCLNDQVIATCQRSWPHLPTVCIIEWVVISASLQGHLRETPLSAFLASCHAQKAKIKSKLAEGSKPVHALEGPAEGSTVLWQEQLKPPQAVLCPALRCTADSREPKMHGKGLFYFFFSRSQSLQTQPFCQEDLF